MKYSNKLPSISPELYMAYDNSVRRSLNFSTVPLHSSVYNFTQISNVFELSDYVADKLAVIGHEYNFGEVGIDRFRVDLFNQIHDDTHIGLLLSCVSKKRKEECFSYGMWADFISIGKTVYCALTVCFVDKDSAYEMPVSVMEFTGINECSVQPIFIEEDAVEEYFSYFTYNDDEWRMVGAPGYSTHKAPRISAIYLGHNISLKDEKKIIKIAKKKHISLFYTWFDYDNTEIRFREMSCV